MTDLLLNVADSEADLVVENGDLALDEGLRTSVLVSMFTDARLPDEIEVPDGSSDRRGWWGTPVGGVFGSLLWQYSRSKITALTMEGIRETTVGALTWLIAEGIVEDLEVVVERSGRTVNELLVTVVLTRGTATRWPSIWQGVQDDAATVAGLEVLVLAR